MITIDELRNMLENARVKAEDIYDADGSNYSKGFIVGQIHLLSYLIQEGGVKC